MLDIKFVRENKEIVAEALRKRRSKFDLNRLLRLDVEKRRLLGEVEAARAEQNKTSESIRSLTGEERALVLSKMKTLKEELSANEEQLKKTEHDFNRLIRTLPNIPDPAVPEGDSEDDNVEIRKVGDSPKFNFTARDYMTLLTENYLIDFERGVKVTGSRGYFLKNEAVLLSMGLWQFAMDFLVKKGFTPFAAPALIREDIYIGSGKLPLFKDDLYATDDDLYLSSTAEVPMMGYHSDEILNESELPKKFVAISSCYRREAGVHGKDTRGLFRVHEFMKIEQVVLCKAEYQESVKWHEELTQYSEDMLKALGIPYRVVINSTGDLPFAAVKMYDIESWVPSENRYRESHSSSIIRDFQTRRLNIRYRGEDGKVRFAHSLNNTAIATPRILHSLLEIYQNADGSITVPEALRKFVGKEVIGPRK